MDPPRLDASRPGGLRFAGFVLAVAGATLLGVGAVQTWVTVGVGGFQTNTNTAIPGVDLADGKVALGCAVALLLGTLAGRLVRNRAVRMGFGSLAIAAGVVGAVVTGAFLQNGIDRPLVLDVLAIPAGQWGELGAFREYGVGPYLALGGGVLGFFSGILTLAWAQRISR